MTEKPIWVEHNLETDELIEREFTAAELKQVEKDAKEFQAIKDQITSDINKKQEILKKLGLSEDEVLTLLS